MKSVTEGTRNQFLSTYDDRLSKGRMLNKGSPTQTNCLLARPSSIPFSRLSPWCVWGKEPLEESELRGGGWRDGRGEIVRCLFVFTHRSDGARERAEVRELETCEDFRNDDETEGER